MTESLRGRTIALLETRRREELAEVLPRRGGTPLSAPCLREVPAEDRDLLHATRYNDFRNRLSIATNILKTRLDDLVGLSDLRR